MKFFRYFLISILAISTLLYWLFPPVFKLPFIQASQFQAIPSTLLYIENGTSASQHDSLIVLDYLAKKSIEDFFGKRTSESKTFFCKDKKTYETFCSNADGAGCSLATPFGNWIFLNGSSGLQLGVMAHENAHAELYKQMGWWKMKTEIPTWFDEGFAIMFDSRFSESNSFDEKYLDFKTNLELFSLGNQYQLSLDKLATEKQFFGVDASYAYLAYLTSGMHLSYFISKYGKETFLNNLKTIQEGKAFNSVFEIVQFEERKMK